MRPETLLTLLGVLALLLALLPLVLAWRNLRVFASPTVRPPRGVRVSVLIPARDEAATIARCVAAALASRGVEIEVLVLDDQSGDDTARIVSELAARDPRVRLVLGGALPPGWTGKQRACWLLAAQARHEVLMFVDAGVELRPRAAAAAAGLLLKDSRLGLVSGFPRQLAASFVDRLAVPWIPLGLLGYLPLSALRSTLAPALAAGSGQWMVARRRAYLEVNGHGADPSSCHDGISLPRRFRAGGWKTDVFDAGALARCRRARTLHEVWQGFGRAVVEGQGLGPAGVPLSALLLLGGHVLPWVLLPWALVAQVPAAAILAGLGIVANLALRAMLARRFGQHWHGIALHAPSAAFMVALQLWFLLCRLARRPVHWRGRSYTAAPRRRPRLMREPRVEPPPTRPQGGSGPGEAPAPAQPAQDEGSTAVKSAAA